MRWLRFMLIPISLAVLVSILGIVRYHRAGQLPDEIREQLAGPDHAWPGEWTPDGRSVPQERDAEELLREALERDGYLPESAAEFAMSWIDWLYGDADRERHAPTAMPDGASISSNSHPHALLVYVLMRGGLTSSEAVDHAARLLLDAPRGGHMDSRRQIFLALAELIWIDGEGNARRVLAYSYPGIDQTLEHIGVSVDCDPNEQIVIRINPAHLHLVPDDAVHCWLVNLSDGHFVHEALYQGESVHHDIFPEVAAEDQSDSVEPSRYNVLCAPADLVGRSFAARVNILQSLEDEADDKAQSDDD